MLPRALWSCVVLFVAAGTAQRVQINYDSERGDQPLLYGKECNCNGRSDRCVFDRSLWERTGHGGRCIDCTGNTDGPNCERCKPNFYMHESTQQCLPCRCNEVGSTHMQCNSQGACECKAGVGGEKCDRCLANHFGFGQLGCAPCHCLLEGSLENSPRCDPITGDCQCKANVEGKRCDKCKPGYFSIDRDNKFGCTPCFCFGHAAICDSAVGYGKVVHESVFSRSTEGWKAADRFDREHPMQYSPIPQAIGVSAVSNSPIYFVAPVLFLGDQRTSYNRELSFRFRIGEINPIPSPEDIIVEGSGLKISQSIGRLQMPSIKNQDYRFILHESPEYGWNPRLSSRDFMRLLSNITAVRIRGTYSHDGRGFLSSFRLSSASRGLVGEGPANWVERCTCPAEYVGQFCESCAPGNRHDPANGGPFSRCVRCDCNKHADTCDPDSGQCICRHNTAGVSCDICGRGYYGNALQGTPTDCKACPCPEQGGCIELLGDVICTECPKGYSGHRCDVCADGYFGDPNGVHGPPTACQPCDCNGNVDPNAIGNCNRTTGECLKCAYSTAGPRCERCLPGYYGDPLSLEKGSCRPCGCNALGTQEASAGIPLCNEVTGQCTCKFFVIGQKCDRCADGYYNLRRGTGCARCDCDPVGSHNQTCHEETGQCFCKPGITGRRCDACSSLYYGFSFDGCKVCGCDATGSTDLQCDAETGQCPCRTNVEGQQCERCMENKFNKERGCLDCPPCFNLIRDEVWQHRSRLDEVESVLEAIAKNPSIAEDATFQAKLLELQVKVETLLADAKASSIAASGSDKSLAEQLEALYRRLQELQEIIHVSRRTVFDAGRTSDDVKDVVGRTEAILDEARRSLQDAKYYLETEGQDALRRAMEKSDQYGIQNEKMSNLSREARQLADGHEKKAAEIEKVSHAALNTSKSAWELAMQAIQEQRETSDELRKLRNDAEAAEERFRSTREQAQQAQREATQAHDAALTLITEADLLNPPAIDTDSIERMSSKIKEEAIRINEAASKLVEENADMMAAINSQIEEANLLLRSGIHQQQVADRMLSEVEDARAQAQAAVDRGDSILKEAEGTLNTLLKFDEEVQNSRTAAEEAKRGIPEIRRIIQEAEDLTKEASSFLDGAKQDAENARQVALEAKRLAEQSSKDASQMRQETEETRSLADQLKESTSTLSAESERLMNNLDERTQQATQEEELADKALQTSDEAGKSAKDATERVNEGLAAVEAIQRELRQISSIDESELAKLEEKFERAREEILKLNLNSTLADLKVARSLQKKWTEDLEEKVQWLRKEVDIIEDIRDSLPVGCFKRVKLEP